MHVALIRRCVRSLWPRRLFLSLGLPLVMSVVVVSSGCASAFRVPAFSDSFPELIKSPDNLIPTQPASVPELSSKRIRGKEAPTTSMEGPAQPVVPARVTLVERGSDRGRSQRWIDEVKNYTATILNEQLLHGDGALSTNVEFEFVSRTRSLTGGGAGASDIVIRLSTTLPSGDIVHTSPQRGAFFSDIDTEVISWSTIPVSVGLGLVVSSLLLPELPLAALSLLGVGAVLSLGGLVAAVVVEQSILRTQQQRWSDVYLTALLMHATDIRERRERAPPAQLSDANVNFGGRFLSCKRDLERAVSNLSPLDVVDGIPLSVPLPSGRGDGGGGASSASIDNRRQQISIAPSAECIRCNSTS